MDSILLSWLFRYCRKLKLKLDKISWLAIIIVWTNIFQTIKYGVAIFRYEKHVLQKIKIIRISRIEINEKI